MWGSHSWALLKPLEPMRDEGFLNAPFSQPGIWGPLTSDVFFSEPRKNLTISLQLLSARLCPKPSGAMLLLVTLALLAGPTCRAQSEYLRFLWGLHLPSHVLSIRASVGGRGPRRSHDASLSDILGNNVGTYFYVAGEEHGQLRGLRIFLSVIDLIKG